MRNTVLMTTALALVVCTAPAWGQGPPGPGRPPGGVGGGMSCPAMAAMAPPSAVIDRMAETLGLTKSQVTKLRAAMTKCEESIKSLSQKSGEATKAMRDAIAASDYDAQKVTDLANAAVKAEVAVLSARLDEWTQIRSILTADQAKGLQESMTMQRPGQVPRPAGPPPDDGAMPPPPRDQ